MNLNTSKTTKLIAIPPVANELIHSLRKKGYEAYVVGGCVRDSVLGRVPHDWDICTSATPEEMLSVFKGKNIVTTGIEYGTITIVENGVPYEITTYRTDSGYSDGRHPDAVTFTRSLKEDLKRRDFTMNAMAYNDAVGLIDPFDGRMDLTRGIIRCVGSPEERFEEDGLRILRAFRFACQLGFEVHPSIAIYAYEEDFKDKLNHVSVERITNEFVKMITAESFPDILAFYPSVFSRIIPELNPMYGFRQNNPYHKYDVFQHTRWALEFCPSNDLITKLAVFFHDFGKPATYQEDENGVGHFHGHGKVSAEMTDEIMRRMRFDNDTREKVVELVKYHDTTFETTEKCVKRWLNRIGEEQFRRLLNVRCADVFAQSDFEQEERLNKISHMQELLEEVLQKQSCFSLKDLAVNGNDLIAIGFKPGKTLGEVLKMLLEGVIEEKYENEKEGLLKIADLFLAFNGGTS